MINYELLDEVEFKHCEDCVDPDACSTQCFINKVVTEDVAEIRGEAE